MGWIRIILVFMLLGRAIYTDVKKGIIENHMMGIGLIVAGIWTSCNAGTEGLLQSTKMVLLIFGILFVFYLVKGIGGGDVKLLCVMAAFFPEDVVNIVVVSFITAAVISVGKMVVRGIRGKKVYVSGETMLFSIPIGIGTGMVLLQHYIR